MNTLPTALHSHPHPHSQAQTEIAHLHIRLREAEETLDAIRYGRVDALVVSKSDEEKIFTLQGAEHTYRMMVETMNEGVITLTPDGTILYCNQCFSDMLKIPLNQIVGKSLLTFVVEKNISIVHRMLLGEEPRKAEIWLLDGDAAELPIFLSPKILKIQDEPTIIYMVAMDLTIHKRYEARLEHQANYDALTGLANRNRLHDRLQQAIVSAQRCQHQVAVAFIDLDQFKFVNDSLGHHVGDYLLKVVAMRLKSCMRENDMVAHYGGDEFVVMIDHSDEAALSLLVPRLLACIAEPVMVDDRELQVTCSIGFSIYPIDGRDADTLLKNADAAMYRAKEQGRNNAQFYTEELNQKIRKRLSMESMLRQALKRNEFFLHYQPQVDLRTGRVTGVEALIRWRHEPEGLISPADFIPLAEELGLIVPIGKWVLQTACNQMKAWQDAGLPKICIAVNLSTRQFRQKDLVEMIACVLEETGLDPCYLEIELTESMMMHNIEAAVATLGKLKGMGIKLSIDDFGTGYSSLNYLKRFPIDVLKIDQSFVRDITSDADDAAIARSIITLAHSLKLKVIAEGVETEAQLNYLGAHHCDVIQGYYYSQPMPADACEQWLLQEKKLTISFGVQC
jgi:diguanylate cyclase (GGDEF)-like protein/PAS domain S-box-containing protein